MLREERDPASVHPSVARGCRDKSNHWTTGWAQAKGRRQGIFLKGKEALGGPKGWRRDWHVRAGMRASHVRLAGRSEVTTAVSRHCTFLPLSSSSVKGPPGGDGPKRPKETIRVVQSPRLDLKALRNLVSISPSRFKTPGFPHSRFRGPLETDSRTDQWQGAKRQLCVRPPLSASVCGFLPSPAFRVGRPLLATHGRTLSASILSVAKVVSQNPFIAILVFLLTGQIS